MRTNMYIIVMLFAFVVLTNLKAQEATAPGETYTPRGAQDVESYVRPCPDALDIQIAVKPASGENTRDGAIDISVHNASGPLHYSWSGRGLKASSQDLRNIPAGEYYLVVRDSRGCDATALVTVESGSVTSSLSESSHSGDKPHLSVVPNPSRGGDITLHYSLPGRTMLSLRVYDQLGRSVTVPFTGVRDAGVYSIVLSGNLFRAGAYFCELRTDGEATTAKFLVSQ